MEKKNILFICTHNANRSQIAEGLMRQMLGSKYNAYSAGSTPSIVNPNAIKVLNESGIDTSMHKSKNFDGLMGIPFDYVVTLCGGGEKTCPFFPGAKKYIHVPFDDPSLIKGTEEEVMQAYRKTRDQIKQWIEETFKEDLC
ncbi:MAG: arsenate reductase ArsC [Endomicrobiales bacterium]|nr:arsenate reductase ArsC [Endomicrobiales bacterium]